MPFPPPSSLSARAYFSGNERPLLRRRQRAAPAGRAPRAPAAASAARGLRGPGADPRPALRAATRDRGGPRGLDDPARAAGNWQDDASADRRAPDRRLL